MPRFAEEALDEIALAVERLAEARLPFAVGFGRNVGNGALCLDQVADAVGVIGLVAEHDGAWGKAIKEGGTSGRTAMPNRFWKAAPPPAGDMEAWRRLLPHGRQARPGPHDCLTLCARDRRRALAYLRVKQACRTAISAAAIYSSARRSFLAAKRRLCAERGARKSRLSGVERRCSCVRGK